MEERVGWLHPRLHRYLSTACRHHDAVRAERCRRTCKFCGARCRCWCHDRRGWRHPVRWVRYQLRRGMTRALR